MQTSFSVLGFSHPQYVDNEVSVGTKVLYFKQLVRIQKNYDKMFFWAFKGIKQKFNLFQFRTTWSTSSLFGIELSILQIKFQNKDKTQLFSEDTYSYSSPGGTNVKFIKKNHLAKSPSKLLNLTIFKYFSSNRSKTRWKIKVSDQSTDNLNICAFFFKWEAARPSFGLH